MSAEAFRQVASNIPELKYWSSGQKDTSSVLHSGRKESKGFIDKSKVEHIIPLEQLSNMLGDTQANLIFNEIKSGKYITGFENVSYVNSGGQESIVFEQVTFGNLNPYVTSYLDSILSAADPSRGSIKQTLLDKLSDDKMHKGHVYGWANTLVNRTKDSMGKEIAGQTDKPKEEIAKDLNALNRFIDTLLDTLEEYDQQVSGIKGLNATIFAKYKKTSTNWLTTWEMGIDNSGSGSNVGKAIGLSSDKGVRAFIKNATTGQESLAAKALEGMVKGFIDATLTTSGSNNIANLKSSPSMVELITDDIVSSLTGKPKSLKKEYIGTISNIAKVTLRKVESTKAKQSIIKAKKELEKLAAKVKKASAAVSSLRSLPPAPRYSLSSLQILINTHLQSVIASRMGDGSSKSVLNYRTGRLAASAKVERMSQSREGMITAFYSYMKNPYQTFESGFAQGSPKTRDPKLLIAGSIREIAATKVSQRMRAVLI